MRQKFSAVRTSNSALTIQCLARRKIASDRVKSLALARLNYRVSAYSSKIQALMRKYLAKALVSKMKIALTDRRKLNKKNSNIDLVNSVPKKVLKSSAFSEKDSMSVSRHQGSMKGQSTMTKFKSETALISAIVQHDMPAIKSLISLVPPTVEVAVNALASSILSFTSGPSGLQVITLLLDLGLSEYINEIQPESGLTVLQLASQLGNTVVAELLLLYGAERGVTDSVGYSALHRACSPTIPGISSLKMVYLLLGKWHQHRKL
jgi:hypothetical protein